MKRFFLLLLLVSGSAAFAPPRVPLTSQYSARSCASTTALSRPSQRNAQSGNDDESLEEQSNNSFFCSFIPPAIGVGAVVSFDALHGLINTLTDKQALFGNSVSIPISILFASLVSMSIQTSHQRQVELDSTNSETRQYKQALELLIRAFPEPYQSKVTALLKKDDKSSRKEMLQVLQEMTVKQQQQQQEKVPSSLVQQALSLVTSMDVSKAKISSIQSTPFGGFPLQASMVSLGSLTLLQILQQTDNALLWGVVVAIFASLGVTINTGVPSSSLVDGGAMTTTTTTTTADESVRDMPSNKSTELSTTRQKEKTQPVAATTVMADSWANETTSSSVDKKARDDDSLLGALGGAASEIFQTIIKSGENMDEKLKEKEPVKSKSSPKESVSTTAQDSTKTASVGPPRPSPSIAKNTTQPVTTSASQLKPPKESTGVSESTKKKTEAPKATSVGRNTTVPSRRNATSATTPSPAKSVPSKPPAPSTLVTPVSSSTSMASGRTAPVTRSSLPDPLKAPETRRQAPATSIPAPTPPAVVPAATKSDVGPSRPAPVTSIPAPPLPAVVPAAAESNVEASRPVPSSSVPAPPPPAPVPAATKSAVEMTRPLPASSAPAPQPQVSVPSNLSSTGTTTSAASGSMRADGNATARTPRTTSVPETSSSGSTAFSVPPSYVPLASDGSSQRTSEPRTSGANAGSTTSKPPAVSSDSPVGVGTTVPVPDTSVSATIPESPAPRPAPAVRPANGAFDRSSRVGPSFSAPAPSPPPKTIPAPASPPPPLAPVTPAVSTPGFGNVASASPATTIPSPNASTGVSQVTPNVEDTAPAPPSIPATPQPDPVSSFDVSSTEAQFADYVASLGAGPAYETQNSAPAGETTGASYPNSMSTESTFPEESGGSDWVKNRESTSPIPAATVPMPGMSPAVANPPAQMYTTQTPAVTPPMPATPPAIPQPASEMIRPKPVEVAPGIAKEEETNLESTTSEAGVAEKLKPRPPDPSMFTEEMPIKMPIMGKYEIKVVKWYKQKGDMVEYNDLLCDIETEDFTFGMVNEEKFAAKMGDIAIPEGQKLYEGDLLCTLYHPKRDVARAMAAKAEAEAAVPASAPAPSELSPSGFPTAVTEAFAKSRIGGNEPRFPGSAARNAANSSPTATSDPFMRNRNTPQASVPAPAVRDFATSQAPTAPVPAARSWGMETVTAPAAASVPAPPPVTPVTPSPSVPDTTVASSSSTTASTTTDSISTPAGADYLSALGGGPAKKMPPKSKPKTATSTGLSTGASYLDNMSTGGSPPDWSRDAETSMPPASASSVPETPVAEERPVVIDKSKFTEPVLFRMPVMGKTQAKVIRWYKKEGDLVEYNDLLCDIETEDFTFGMVNEEEVDALMGEIAVAENSEPIGDGALLCTLFHPKQP